LTANGERFNQGAMTSAHKSLPFGTHVRVVNRDNSRSVVVHINDRGLFIRGRIIDFSYAAFSWIEHPREGLADGMLEILN
jgi:rare lipoprotein A